MDSGGKTESCDVRGPREVGGRLGGKTEEPREVKAGPGEGRWRGRTLLSSAGGPRLWDPLPYRSLTTRGGASQLSCTA